MTSDPNDEREMEEFMKQFASPELKALYDKFFEGAKTPEERKLLEKKFAEDIERLYQEAIRLWM